MHLQPGEQIIIIIQWDLLELSMLLFAPNAHPFSFWTDSFTHISTYWDESRRLTISPISLFKLINGIEPVADSIYLVRAKSKFTRNECTQHNRCQMLIAFSIFYLTCFNSLSHYSRANTFACAGDGSSSTQQKHQKTTNHPPIAIDFHYFSRAVFSSSLISICVWQNCLSNVPIDSIHGCIVKCYNRNHVWFI